MQINRSKKKKNKTQNGNNIQKNWGKSGVEEYPKCMYCVSHAKWHLSLFGAVELKGSCSAKLFFLCGLLDMDCLAADQ